MIKIKRNEIPNILQENQQVWTNELNYLINEYGNYKNIPKKEKDKAVNQYRHRSITEAVISLTNGNCVFCESYIENVDYTNIEHFYPKSLYPKFTFKWSNLFPSCRKCNIKKGDNDTKNQYPIVHPENDDPEEYFIYKNLKISASPDSPDMLKSRNTIHLCNLHRISLCRSYSVILIAFYEVEERLSEYLKEYNALKMLNAKIRKALSIFESVENLYKQAEAGEQYAGFLRYILRDSDVINECVKIINLHKSDLNMKDDFDLYWE